MYVSVYVCVMAHINVAATICVFCVDKREEVYLRQSCSSESSSQSLSPSHTQERRIHLPLSQWKSRGEQVGSTANKQGQDNKSVSWKKQTNTDINREAEGKGKKMLVCIIS